MRSDSRGVFCARSAAERARVKREKVAMRTAGLADMNPSCDLGGAVSNLSCGKRSGEGKPRETRRSRRKKTSGKAPAHEEKGGARDSGAPSVPQRRGSHTTRGW